MAAMPPLCARLSQVATGGASAAEADAARRPWRERSRLLHRASGTAAAPTAGAATRGARTPARCRCRLRRPLLMPTLIALFASCGAEWPWRGCSAAATEEDAAADIFTALGEIVAKAMAANGDDADISPAELARQLAAHVNLGSMGAAASSAAARDAAAEASESDAAGTTETDEDEPVQPPPPVPELAGPELEALFRAGRGAFGAPERPRVVLFHRGDSESLPKLRSELASCAAAAGEAVHFHTLDCAIWRGTCAMRNLPAELLKPRSEKNPADVEPAVVIFPPEGRAAEVYGGLRTQVALQKALLARFTPRNVTLLSKDTLSGFTRERARPLQVAFLPPEGREIDFNGVMVLGAIASDPDLRPLAKMAVVNVRGSPDASVYGAFGLPDETLAPARKRRPALIVQRWARPQKRYAYLGEEGASARAPWNTTAVRAWLREVAAESAREHPIEEDEEAQFPAFDVGQALADLEAAAAKAAEEAASQPIMMVVQHSSLQAQVKVNVLSSATFGDVRRALSQALQNEAVLTSGQLAKKVASGGFLPYDDEDKVGETRKVYAIDIEMPSYKKLGYGAQGCPPGLEIRSVEECARALASLGIQSSPQWVSAYEGLPSWCSVREKTDAQNKEKMHFNSHQAGKGRNDLAPICKNEPGDKAGRSYGSPKKPSTPSAASSAAAAAAAAAAAQATPRIGPEEISDANFESLYGTSGFVFIYMSDGRISAPEAKMLEGLEKQFKPQLQEQGTRMAWSWMDARKERKMKDLFDPQVLPSAVVINPHKRPRFALLKHPGEEEEEPKAADEASLVFLLNTVLGGDARFQKVSGSKLTTLWMPRAGGAGATSAASASTGATGAAAGIASGAGDAASAPKSGSSDFDGLVRQAMETVAANFDTAGVDTSAFQLDGSAIPSEMEAMLKERFKGMFDKLSAAKTKADEKEAEEEAEEDA
eukprot:TRINITY_DN4894_c2_g3_i1.p1 TRINITY_DN4894_c2_g3~~TRINITY_DN4894_c2_g3_i1.p1  ORF type:complete len:973 (+),score=287.01 TRINITY_DN4894_c2_g3_i1:99-2921(+)